MTLSTQNVDESAKRILVMRYRFIGDTILTVPFLRNLRSAYPAAVIDVLVGPQSGQVLEGCPYIDELIEFDTTRFHRYDSGTAAASNFFSYAWQLRKRQYDTAFVLKRSMSSALLSCLIGARHRIGYGMPGRHFLLTKNIKWDPNKHEVESTLDVLRGAGIPVKDNYLEAWTSANEIHEIQNLVPALLRGGNYYLVHAAAAHPDKLYPEESWAQVIQELFVNFGFSPMFTGADSDRSVYERISQICQRRCPELDCINLAGKLTLRQSMALYKQLKFAICVDSGPAHLSAAVGTPTLSIFGPTDPNRWRPFGPRHSAIYDTTLACRPCHYKKTCLDRPCLTKLDARQIVEEAVRLHQLHQGSDQPQYAPTGSRPATHGAFPFVSKTGDCR
jgi:heptosyltransferase-2